MEQLLKRQKEIDKSILRIIRNFKKDPADRKTSKYLNTRTEALQNLWGEYESNDELLRDEEDQSAAYFVNKSYEVLKQEYDAGLKLIITTKPADKTNDNDGDDGAEKSSSEDDKGSPSRSDELLSQQKTNFRAYQRVIKNINIENLTEGWEIQDKLQMLQTRWKTVDELHWKIDNLLEGDDPVYEREFSQHEQIYEKTKTELHRKLNSVQHQQASTPHIELPTFAGNYANWPAFLDLYCEAIHNNPTLNKCQKMQHLKGKLKGEAERLVQHLNISADNYDTCWDILNRRYNNLQLLFTKLMQTFMNQPTMQKHTAYEIKRLHDISLETVHAIHNLGVDTSTWDPILVHIVTDKMDPETYTAYMDARKNKRDLPSFEEMITILESKFIALEPLNKKGKQHKQNIPAKENEPKYKEGERELRIKFARSYKTHAERICPLCQTNEHVLLTCKKFLNMTPEMKVNTVKSMSVCSNCLFYHKNTCTSTKKCKVCNNSHHTVLHEVYDKTASNNQEKPMNSQQRKTYHVAGNDDETMLATIELNIRSKDGTFVQMRCLLDPGSQINLISESAAQRLGLERFKQKATIYGIGTKPIHSNGAIQLVCESSYSNYTFLTEAAVVPRPKLIDSLPNSTFERQPWEHLQSIQLADPNYNISRPVDLLLDAKVYAQIIVDGLLRGPANAPVAQRTQLGWVLFGSQNVNAKTFNCHAVLNNLEEISLYWDMEEITQQKSNMTPSDEYCETLYKNTTTRLPDGRYEVKLPMKPNFEEHLGPSKPRAVAQFKQLEKRFSKDSQLYSQYKQFIDEYKELGHMKPCTAPREPSCYHPHHGVIKPDSLTTKLRTVFNASCKLATGYSLNDLMEGGPNLQKDLQAMLLLWRKFAFVYTADIEKFYRQILVKEEDQHLQKIVWRDSTSDKIHDYQLCTVTYGTKAAPYLALRTIQQLLQDDGDKFPLAVDILNKQLFVDDLLGGSNNIENAIEAQKQITNILKGGGFKLRKWASNNSKLLEHLPPELISQNMFDFKHAETNKTLGLSWNPCTDQFSFQRSVHMNEKAECTTKRELLSHISKLFDPLGWLSPVTIQSKLIFQRVWTLNLDWDDKLPLDVQQEWDTLKQDLPEINEIKINRWIGNTEKPIELHGFCDSSERAFGCVIYCKSMGNDENEQPVVRLMAGKTKLAPLNKVVSLPRLELSGALLLAKLMAKIIDSLNIQKQQFTVHGWTDSMVVLGWLKGDIARWKTFVANRVSNIKDIMPSSCWNHVKSEENPADCASRGILPSQLKSHPLWWEGPEWLKNNNTPEDTPMINITLPEEEKKQRVCLAVNNTQNTMIEELLDRHSSLQHVTRILAWVSRFIHNVRHTDIRLSMNLKVTEIQHAHNLIIRAVQNKHFSQDIEQLRNKNKLHRKSKILNLNPWIDDDGIMRVGGRLSQSNLSHQNKHPMIVPNNDRLSSLLINWAHRTTLHGGARLTLTYLRSKYWMLGGMTAVKRQLRKCPTCVRFKGISKNQQMADLPKPRVTPSPAFAHCGCDLAGPVDVKSNKGRGIATTKGYIAIFICLVTKAVHIELLSDMSSITFLAAFKRLCGRRGRPRHMYSDCGTNFVGAARSLEEEHKKALKHYLEASVIDELANKEVQWHFNAPSWPTAGGLWESAVKQMKHHLKRVLGEQKLTYEEFTTLLTQIEACLNSRPLVALSDSIEDLECLTPGHFLTGDQTLAPPLTQEVEEISLKTRWKLVEKMYKEFWRKWSTEYLQTLQTRSKWHYSDKDLQVGDLVIIKEDNIPPARWLMGRVIQTHPGSDGRVRVVTLKTKNSDGVKRPVNKLIPLPVDPEQKPALHMPEQQPETKNETNAKTKPNTKRKKKQRKCFSTLFNIVFVLFSFFSTGICDNTTKSMKVTALHENKPLYFDKVAEMQAIQDEWKMVVYYNLTNYLHSLANIDYYTNILEDLCKNEPAFKFITSQLRHEVTEIKHYDMMLKNYHGRRSKRGLVDGIGYIANELFGVLDGRFAEKYDQDIKTIQYNENHLRDLYKQQTSVIEGEYNILKRHEDMMTKQFASISQQIAELNNWIQDEHRKAMYVTAATLTANLIINNLRRVQDELLDLVTDVRSGHIDSHLLSPEEFQSQLNIIAAQIPNDITLPCVSGQQECIREMYKLSRVHVRVLNFLIFEVKLPLLSIEPYELNRVIPIPRIDYQTSRAKYIKPTAKYLALNLKKDTIIPLTEEDVHASCLTFTENKLLCRINLPIHTTTKALSTLCEAQIINNNEIISSCESIVKACYDEWIMLHSRAAWLFTCCQQRTIRVFCNDAIVTSETLHGTGIVNIWPGCMLKGENIIIHSPKTYNTELKIKENENYLYLPESGVNDILKEINYTYAPENHTQQFEHIQSQIKTIKASQENLSTLSSSHDTHHYVTYTFMSICVLATILWGGYKVKQHLRQRRPAEPKTTILELQQTVSTPAQRARDETDHEFYRISTEDDIERNIDKTNKRVNRSTSTRDTK